MSWHQAAGIVVLLVPVGVWLCVMIDRIDRGDG